MEVLELPKDCEVIVPTFTNMVTVFSVLRANLQPVPIDINFDTWQMDASQIEGKISKKTKAIVVSHLFGQCVDMDKVMQLAKKYELIVIEDCAQAMGVEFNEQRVGSIGHVGCFSFYGNKTITTGEGGMIISNDKAIVDEARIAKNLGFGAGNKFMHARLGSNYKMSNLSAAVGLSQLKKIQEIFARKEKVHRRYLKNFAESNVSDLFILPKIEPWCGYQMWMFNLSLRERPGFNRDALQLHLESAGIETRKAFVPANRQELFAKNTVIMQSPCSNADRIMHQGLYLPSGATLKEKEVDFICERVFSFAARV